MGYEKKKGDDLMIRHTLIPILLAALISSVILADNSTQCLIVTSLGGLPEYEENFTKWGNSVEEACRDELKASVNHLNGSESKRTEILADFEKIAKSPGGDLWIFLIGHATYDGRNWKFNIKGPDLTGSDLETAVDMLQHDRIFVILATSSGGIMVDQLKGSNRVVLSATKSERERHPPLFMSFFIEALSSAEADTNKDRQVSLMEVFDFSTKKTEAWYSEKNRLQTEHAVMNDNEGGNGLATFAYLSSPPEQAYRSLEARSLVPERIRLEREVEALKLQKAELTQAEYYERLQTLLIELAELNERIRILEGEQ